MDPPPTSDGPKARPAAARRVRRPFNHAPRWEFNLGPELAGAVIEISRQPTTAHSENFRVRLETTGYGADDAVLAEVTGPSVLTAQINRHQADRFYQEGGKVRLTVAVYPHKEDEHMGAGAVFAFQQDFLAHANLFYVDSPPTGYTVHA